jgi:hypothetical protein
MSSAARIDCLFLLLCCRLWAPELGMYSGCIMNQDLRSFLKSNTGEIMLRRDTLIYLIC